MNTDLARVLGDDLLAAASGGLWPTHPIPVIPGPVPGPWGVALTEVIPGLDLIPFRYTLAPTTRDLLLTPEAVYLG